jgi:antirestriction protein
MTGCCRTSRIGGPRSLAHGSITSDRPTARIQAPAVIGSKDTAHDRQSAAVPAEISTERPRHQQAAPARDLKLTRAALNKKGGACMELPPQPGAGPESTGNQSEEHEVLREEGPRIYVASLSDYNESILHGEWIRADQEPEELGEAVQAMLERSPTPGAEEFAIHDFEGFSHYEVNEYDSLDWTSRVARGIVEHGLAFSAWAERSNRDEDDLARFEDAYLGEWGSMSEYAEELLDDLGYLRAVQEAVPEMLQPYVRVDIEAFARDLELSGDITSVTHANGVWLFEGTT